ncbi:carboxypeptidase S [Yamadazyma tenuis ATCC 10573]|uniref:Carboxypeptidase S n=1 Tax=Candida tenuis (strain ATCC 10573 / BCRC 21748 / CBS 615 / JCM 9827 / NBRC 10315 / NRRL Y-1498 / VKM Y-70) TaxID=590646 RepID=G3B7Z7_CANTC|nr:carboxypeptidase S [Yamadazyma tenuis ATCC 10573]EGV61694.1 carboxypeptidase S [Yamadazyma tenuis ATCC 10573]
MNDPLLPINSQPKRTKKLLPKVLAVAAIVVLFQLSDGLCPISDKIDPAPYVYDVSKIGQILKDKEYIDEVVERWSGAIQIPSVSNDVMVNPNTTDDLEELYRLEPAWKQFTKLHEYLEKQYPLIHKHLKVEKVNKFSILITWQGSNTKQKPILLTAHQDVVPVPDETLDQWKYPPFSGAVDGDRIYGRGSGDCKDLLMALFETAELLLKEGKFQPQRTILFGFGYDEESQGTGAVELSKFIFERYGPESLYALIDEGDQGYVQQFGRYVIPIPTGEKGHLNSEIELFTPGGHSSVPPKHTSIGIMAKLIDRIESVDFSPAITNANPLMNALQCMAEHGQIEKSLKSDIIKAVFDANANKKLVEYLSKDPSTEFLIKTSQAVDIIQGGVKSNALPEYVSVVVNHRISAEESVESTSKKILDDIKSIATKFDLGIVFENKTIVEKTKNGYFNYVLNESLEPSPISPIDTAAWNTFTGALRYLYEDVMNPGLNETFVAIPAYAAGNTDTKAYWDLTANIYRYSPYIGIVEGEDEVARGIHSLNEWSSISGHMATISFYYYYLQIVDQIADDTLISQ